MLKIAFVDDDCNLLTSLFVMFQTEGFEVTIYHDGQST
jgi:FixJ family two-component response regulator